MLDMDVEIREMLDDDFDGYDIVENVDEVDNDDCELGEVLKELEGAEEVLVSFYLFIFFDIFLVKSI